jgi:neutral ceramidase
MATISFGAGIRDITPARPVILHGYSARTRRSDGVSEPLRLGSLVLDDGSTRIAIVTVDIVGIHSTEVSLMAKAIEEATGLPASNVLVCASHTHFAPQISTGGFSGHEIGFFTPETGDVRRVLDAAVGSTADAIAALAPGRAETVRIPIASVAFNRRTVKADGSVETNFRYPTEGGYSFSPIDDELTALRFVTSGGTGALLVNYGCHPVTGGNDSQADFYKVSSDYIHYVRRVVEDAWGYPTFFTLGAAGDVVPRDRYGASRKRIGALLGESVVLADRMFKPVEGGVDARRFEIPAKAILTFDPAEARRKYDAEVEACRAAGKTTDGFADALLGRFRSDLYPKNRFDIPIGIFRIGALRLVSLPFEVLSEFSLRMKQRYPASVLLSCAGGYQGYLPFEYEYARGGYEASDRSTHFTPGTADTILERVLEELGRY